MTRCRTKRIAYALVTAPTALGTMVAAAGTSSAVTSAAGASAKLITSPASLVNPLVGTSGSVDTFPGPDMPFGMLQWSPDTSPDRPSGGGYEYNDSQLMGYSLTHISGPGCSAYGDVPILPTVGAIPSAASNATDSFTHAQRDRAGGLLRRHPRERGQRQAHRRDAGRHRVLQLPGDQPGQPADQAEQQRRPGGTSSASTRRPRARRRWPSPARCSRRPWCT